MRIKKIGDAEGGSSCDLTEDIDNCRLKREDGEHGLVDVHVLADVVKDVELRLGADDGVRDSKVTQHMEVNFLDEDCTR